MFDKEAHLKLSQDWTPCPAEGKTQPLPGLAHHGKDGTVLVEVSGGEMLKLLRNEAEVEVGRDVQLCVEDGWPGRSQFEEEADGGKGKARWFRGRRSQMMRQLKASLGFMNRVMVGWQGEKG